MADDISGFNSSEGTDDNEDSHNSPLTPHQRHLRNELYQVERRFSLQRPPDPPLHLPTLPLTGEGGSTARPLIGSVLKEPMVDVESLYLFKAVLGKGRYAITFLCLDRQTGKPYACKRIKKNILNTHSAEEKIRREIKILHYLSGLPNIVKFYWAYEDRSFIYLFMELFSGGSLSMKINHRRRLSEARAATIFREIIVAVHNCHLMGVMHRDLKPENVMLADEREDSSVMIIDFGLSRFLQEGKKFHHCAGTLKYSAPEVLRKRYGKEADIWSTGTILYFLLSGQHPFQAGLRTPEPGDLQRAILKGRFDLRSEPWPSISDAVKDLIKRMLQPDSDKRITTEEILRHAWVRGTGEPAAVLAPSWFLFISRLRQIREMKFLSRLAHMVMVEALSQDDLRHYKQMFVEMPIAQHGALSFEELWNKLYLIGSRVNKVELMAAIDPGNVENIGNADFMELLAAIVPPDHMQNTKFQERVFSHIRDCGARYISRHGIDNSIRCYGCQVSREAVDEAYREIGLGPDDNIGVVKFVEDMLNVKAAPSVPMQVKKALQCSMS